MYDATVLVRHDPTVEATPEAVREVQLRLAALGRLELPAGPTSELDAATSAALEDWAGEVNLEGRLHDDGTFSQHLLNELRDITPEVGPGGA
jgi:hypothetical protein